jgi:hypothetical protein
MVIFHSYVSLPEGNTTLAEKNGEKFWM